MSDIITVNKVSKSYANHKALDNVSLNIPLGSVFGLLGPNGAGKTSLIRIINQITGPDSGEVLFNGMSLHKSHINEIGYLPEERGLYKKMAVGDQALYLAQLKGMSRSDATKRLKYWFERFEIKSWWTKKVEELSKGMQQKIQFIVTVVHEPKLLILDEPFTGFDPINANLIRDELIILREKGTSIVLSTHRMESVEALCTDIALLNKSNVILSGSIKDIRKSYRSNLFEIQYSGNTIALANSLWGGFQLVSNENKGEYMSAVIQLSLGVTTNNLLENLISNVTIHSFKEVVPDMNDIFIRTVQNSLTPTSNE